MTRGNAQRLNEEDRLRLAAHRLLHDIATEARDLVIDGFHVEEFDSEQEILAEGEKNTRLFIVLKGSVSVKLPKRARRVSEVKLAALGAGDILGEYSLFDGQPVSATVYATEPTRIAWIEKRVFDEFVDSHREAGRGIYENFARILVTRLRAKDAELDILTVG